MKKLTANKRREYVPSDYDEKNMVTLTRAEERALGIPEPGEIAKSLKLERITLNLEPGSVAFFKRQGKKYDVSYQELIREVLFRYAHA